MPEQTPQPLLPIGDVVDGLRSILRVFGGVQAILPEGRKALVAAIAHLQRLRCYGLNLCDRHADVLWNELNELCRVAPPPPRAKQEE